MEEELPIQNRTQVKYLRFLVRFTILGSCVILLGLEVIMLLLSILGWEFLHNSSLCQFAQALLGPEDPL